MIAEVLLNLSHRQPRPGTSISTSASAGIARVNHIIFEFSRDVWVSYRYFDGPEKMTTKHNAALLTRGVEAFLKKTAIAYHQNLAFLL